MAALDRNVRTLSAELSTGRAEIEIYASRMPPETLFGFGERRNPRRSFLFVSHVLGRHVPVSPALMRRTYDMLAADLPPSLPGPVLVIGMAETAVGLGAGVHDSFVRASGRGDVLYLPSTRHPMGGPILARFREEHSHATHHLIHVPPDAARREMALNARTIVLVDDEISSGKTMANVASALAEAGLRPEHVVCACITDWSDRRIAGVVGGVFPDARIGRAFICEGRYTWTQAPDAVLPEMPTPDIAEAGDYELSPSRDWGRLGIVRNRRMLDAEARPGRRTLVLGTSEFAWQPFLLAERLEAQGELVRFSAVTRSPAMQGYAIGSVLECRDNYGLGIPNYAYNVRREDHDRILLCVETPADSVDPRLIAALSPKVISLTGPAR